MALGQAFSVVAIMEAQVVNPFGNALVPDMIADASIQEIDGMFYCYATTDGYGRGLETSGPPVVWKSKDFVHWSFEGTYFPSAATEKYWAAKWRLNELIKEAFDANGIEIPYNQLQIHVKKHAVK